MKVFVIFVSSLWFSQRPEASVFQICRWVVLEDHIFTLFCLCFLRFMIKTGMNNFQLISSSVSILLPLFPLPRYQASTERKCLKGEMWGNGRHLPFLVKKKNKTSEIFHFFALEMKKDFYLPEIIELKWTNNVWPNEGLVPESSSVSHGTLSDLWTVPFQQILL